MCVHVPAWGLWWSDKFDVTFARLSPERWIPIPFLLGLDTELGTVDGYKVRDGYGPNGMPKPKYAYLRSTDEKTGNGYVFWESVRT